MTVPPSAHTRRPRRPFSLRRRSAPLPAVAGPVGDRRIALGRLAVIGTVLAWIAYFVPWLTTEFIDGGAHTLRAKIEAVSYLVVVSLLTASALSYLVCRLGYFYRVRDHARVPRAVLDSFFAQSMPSLSVIVPSYREEERFIRSTLLSAALQEYPFIRVTLLIDDPVAPTNSHDRELLETARRLPGEIQAILELPRTRFNDALEGFENSLGATPLGESHMVELAEHYDFAVSWLDALAHETPIVDHADEFFADHVLRGLAADLAMTAAALRGAIGQGVVLPATRVHQLYRRLAWTFRADLNSFERKQYANLSHEANKAMNLNSYIGLMGQSYRDIETVGGRILLPTTHGVRDLFVPDPDYVLTLDADSVLLPEYCLRLVHLLEQGEHQRVAVAQTPYSSYPGAATRLEAIAGATTDIQYIAHQGMSHYDAGFWVGANAVLRKEALNEIRSTTHVGNWEVHRYIQDRTVIEDTESTIDLREHGWQVLNYPERLSYSATPPDFGALSIQRRRWANGGLLILPKLRRQIRGRRRRGEPTRFGETFVRLNYMASIAWSSLSLVLLLVYPFNSALLLPQLAVIPLPYFVAVANDLRANGYRRLDVLRIYGLNLILLPVNLAGVGSSIVQVLVGDKSVFGRTPKVQDRTVPSLLFIVSPYVMAVFAGFTLWRDVLGHRWDNGAYAALNLVMVSYAIVAFIGLRHSVADTWRHVKARLYKPVKPPARVAMSPAAVVAHPPALDWASVLHFGTLDPGVRTARVPSLSGTADLEASLAQLSPSSDVLREGDVAAFVAQGRFAAFHTVFQSIWDLASQQEVGFEALTRFDDGVAPDDWLAAAARRGEGLELEVRMTRAAVSAARSLPTGAWLALNVSVDLVSSGALEEILADASRPVVLEVDIARVRTGVAFLKWSGDLPQGAALALTGLAPNANSVSLMRELRPQFAKLNDEWPISLANGDGSTQRLIRQLIRTADQVKCTLITQGIETQAQLDAVDGVGVRVGQGYYLGRPRQPTALSAQELGSL